jgi:nucleotide-binding universal stress UspA family protein
MPSMPLRDRHLLTDSPRAANEPSRLRILCATDLSSRSDAAIQRAMNLARTLDGKLLLLHVVDDAAPIRVVGRTAAHALDALRWHAKRCGAAQVRPELSVRIGRPIDIVANVARRWRADAIVIGSHRRRRIEQVRSSTAERIARAAHRPVLVVNTNSTEDYAGVVFVANREPANVLGLMNRFGIGDAPYRSIVPQTPLVYRLRIAAAKLARRLGWRAAHRWNERLRARAMKATGADEFESLGFEILRETPDPARLLASTRGGRGPQMLVVQLQRLAWLDRSHAQTLGNRALRERMCDVLFVV